MALTTVLRTNVLHCDGVFCCVRFQFIIYQITQSSAWAGFLGRGSEHQLRGVLERCKLHSGVQGGAPADKRFSRALSVHSGLCGSLVLFIVPCKRRIFGVYWYNFQL